MDWRDIPSLPALRAFEVAARLGSYSAAAAELNVTHAAVAQHVRALEKDFGTALMRREGRGMAPTAAGARLAQHLSDGFGTIGAGVRALRQDRGDRPLAVTTTFSFAEGWLMPRLPKFWAAHPDIVLSITPSTRVVDLVRDGYDLALRYGAGDWAGHTAELLVESDNIVVGPPAHSARRTRHIADLADLPWLFETHFTEYRAWAAREGLPMDGLTLRELDTINLVLSVLRAGGGIAVVGRAVVQDDLRRGALALLYESTRAAPPGYHIVTHRGVPHPHAATFRRWLRAEARADQAGGVQSSNPNS